MKPTVNIFWFRRDLRLNDNAALYHALKSPTPVLPIFIFDTHILQQLEDKEDKRVAFIHQTLQQINTQLQLNNCSLTTFNGKPLEAFEQLQKHYNIKAVFANYDYEVYAQERDTAITNFLADNHINFYSYKDQIIFDKLEITKDDGKPYTVFTPYSRKWKACLKPFYVKPYPCKKYFNNFHQTPFTEILSLESLGFKKPENLAIPSLQVNNELIKHYDKQRDYPALQATSQLGVHLRFGTISIRELVSKALALNEVFLNELIWRDFYFSILYHFPHINYGKAFKPEYDFIEWRNNEAEFEKWCTGNTGYPIVDAGMRQLNATGYMHNRVRMIVASFLTKHLLIDWRWGEAYFAQKLLDFDFAANNGGWQWAAGSGCDAAPYFRVFNPTLQTQKFDKNLKYIQQWVPEFNSLQYVAPIVPHELARKRCLEVYAKALKK